ncbi:hypothetical protein KEM56_001816 [Ascosphaera pollenicola]|nr:hypothetical protein KEM56_001816 [Ascosphaera pollenicola]
MTSCKSEMDKLTWTMIDAVPKKRGPKTDVLEALMKRVDGLEKQLQEEQRKSGNAAVPQPETGHSPSPSTATKRKHEVLEAGSLDDKSDTKVTTPRTHPAKRSGAPRNGGFMESGVFPTEPVNYNHAHSTTIDNPQVTPPPPNQFMVIPDSVLDTFFARVNGKPFYLLDEQSVRQQHRTDQLPSALSMALYALTMRYTSWSNDSLSSLRRLSQNYASRARRMVDPDSPSLDNLQTLLILSLSLLANGQGKKSYLIFGITSI